MLNNMLNNIHTKLGTVLSISQWYYLIPHSINNVGQKGGQT